MNWSCFPYFVFVSCFFLASGLFFLFKPFSKPCRYAGHVTLVTGISTLLLFIILLWISLKRPPFKTLGETRLWYAFFLTSIGYLAYIRWKYWWFMLYCSVLALLFLIINLLHPDTFSKELMPALQSIWFIPHVIVYISGYALLAASSLVAINDLIRHYLKKGTQDHLYLADNFVNLGFTFITFGLLFGALWAKEAWGHYWTWDPKETWAFVSWMTYLVYLHYRIFYFSKNKAALWILGLAFAALLICWMGINYLPSAQNSVHVYTR
jgi:ABC-type transport system involved in cytochrome c biogenesis permease subunit